MTGAAPLELHPDRLLPPEPGVRAIARRLYETIRALPIVSPRGHVDTRVLLDHSRTRVSITCSHRSPPTVPRSCRCASCRRSVRSVPQGRTPAGATLVLGAWVAHLRGAGTPVVDVRADEIVPLAAGPLPDAVRRVVTYLDPTLGADPDVVSAVLEAADGLDRQSRR
jgi:hypothetical protein